MYQVAIRVLTSGERALFVLDDRGCPLFYPTLFATAQLRNPGASANTIKNKLADIVVLLQWQGYWRRDLVDDFGCGRFLAVAATYSRIAPEGISIHFPSEGRPPMICLVK